MELAGSCHCGQITFKARNVDLDGVHKCNCKFCTKIGLFHTDVAPRGVLLSPQNGESGLVELTWAQPIPPGYEDKLAFRLSQGQTTHFRWYSCLKCLIFLFSCRVNTTDNSQETCSVSLRCLDLTPTGETMKTLTHRDRVVYCEAANNTDQERRGEPFEGGEW